MRFVDQMSLDEMAFLLKENKNTVSVRLHRALSEAREFLTLPLVSTQEEEPRHA